MKQASMSTTFPIISNLIVYLKLNKSKCFKCISLYKFTIKKCVPSKGYRIQISESISLNYIVSINL